MASYHFKIKTFAALSTILKVILQDLLDAILGNNGQGGVSSAAGLIPFLYNQAGQVSEIVRVN